MGFCEYPIMPNLEHPQDGVHNSAMNEKIAGLLIESIPIICSNTYQSLAESLKIHSIFPLPVPVLQLHLYRTYWFSKRGILRFSVWRFHIIGYTWTLPASSHRQVLQYYIIWNLYWSLYLYLHISRGDADTKRRWKPKAGGRGDSFFLFGSTNPPLCQFIDIWLPFATWVFNVKRFSISPLFVNVWIFRWFNWENRESRSYQHFIKI